MTVDAGAVVDGLVVVAVVVVGVADIIVFVIVVLLLELLLLSTSLLSVVVVGVAIIGVDAVVDGAARCWRRLRHDCRSRCFCCHVVVVDVFVAMSLLLLCALLVPL